MKIKHMKIVYTIVWPVLIDIKWAPIKFTQMFFIIKFSRFTVLASHFNQQKQPPCGTCGL